MGNDLEKNIECIIESIDPNAERLKETPTRVVRSYKEFFSGYNTDFNKSANVTYQFDIDEIVMLKNIPFESHCEHHMVPIVGVASVGYVPNGKIIGASKLARIVDCFANRLQLQERLTVEIATAVNSVLNPRGVAVYIEAEHFCITTRGVKKRGASFVTRYFMGSMKEDYNLRSEFLLECKK
jgi:GTP cyclohydrolase I